MQIRVVRSIVEMANMVLEPKLQLGLQAGEVMEYFHRAIRTPDRIPLRDLITSGGNSYADLSLTIKTFRGNGLIRITPDAMHVELKDVIGEAKVFEAAKDHFQLCAETAGKVFKDLEISERRMRATMWMECDGGPSEVETFLSEKGNAALKLDQGPYANLKKEFTIQFSGLDASKATKIGFALEPSITEDAHLFVQFDHILFGNPVVTNTVKEQFEWAENEANALIAHVGLT